MPLYVSNTLHLSYSHFNYSRDIYLFNKEAKKERKENYKIEYFPVQLVLCYYMHLLNIFITIFTYLFPSCIPISILSLKVKVSLSGVGGSFDL